MKQATQDLFVGIDFGTSGCRAAAIDANHALVANVSCTLPPPLRQGKHTEQDPDIWWQAFKQVIDLLLQKISSTAIKSIAIDGTSATVLACTPQGEPLAPALMYNDMRAEAEAQQLSTIAPDSIAGLGANSGLAKAMWLTQHHQQPGNPIHVLHQADWILGRLTENYNTSDTNNCLKMGYDPILKTWPAWLQQLALWQHAVFPSVMPPGSRVANIDPQVANQLSLSAQTLLVTGTTDSTAACIATGAGEIGDAITSLGSTLVLKIIADTPISDPNYGIYSQPFGDKWLVGGASNSGGAVLKHYFTDSDIAHYTRTLNPEQSTNVNYYPLITPGERFPINDANLQPILTPRPADDQQFFQAILEGIAHIEKLGYQRLSELGAPKIRKIYSTGGGSKNLAWQKIRANLTGLPIVTAQQQEAAYGTALLAKRALA